MQMFGSCGSLQRLIGLVSLEDIGVENAIGVGKGKYYDKYAPEWRNIYCLYLLLE
jgi:hypothetical protein